ncbi:restriction endonuclease subunit S [Olsenella phocaeensis]|uniref:restriction endonuclease subunit S n=1 Tax=Olsenella phocaeensis TaxID=1852385 RepID=UPI003A8E9381
MSTPLKELCELIVDCPHSTAPDEGVGYPLIRTPNIGPGYLDLANVQRVSKEVYNSRNARTVPQPMDLILAREAPAGNVGIIREGQRVCLGQRTVLIRPNQEKVDPWYLNYYLNAPQQRHRLLSSANGATVSHVNMPVIRNLPVSLPDLRTQRATAAVLQAYDNFIENNRRQIKLLEEAAQRLYREWFIDLNFPGHKNAKIVDGVPEGWSRLRLKDLAPFRRGKVITAKVTQPGKIPVVAGGLGPAYYHSKSNAAAPVITVSGSGANAGFTRLYHQDIWASDCSYLSSSDTPYIYFVYLCVKVLGRGFKHLQCGSAQPHVYPSHINDLEILQPDASTLKKFECIANLYYEKTKYEIEQISEAQEARDRLLPKLMSGEIKA